MSIKKYNTYFKEEDGKIYYYDENGEKKNVPSQAFADLQEQIDNIGKPLTYSGSKSVTEINTLEEIKIGTVYTITGEAGNITAGNVDVIQGDEIAWGGDPAQWFNIGKDKVDSWKIWSEEHNSSGDNNSVYLGENLTANNSGYLFGNGLNRENDTNKGMIITMSNDLIDENYKNLSSYRNITGRKYTDDDGNIIYSGITFTANELFNNSATQGGISIGRAVTSEASIALSPKFNGLNTNSNGIIGTKATNESVAIGENVIANDGSIALGKNGMSATDASIGIGRMGAARGASVLVSNDLGGRNNTPFSGKLWAYYDETEEKYKPFDKYNSVTYKNYQTIQNKIYNKNTSAFESLYGQNSPIYILFLNTWDGSIGYLTSAVGWGRQYFSGYYDENNNFIRVNSQSEVPSTATLIQAFSANADNGFSYMGNNIFTTTLRGDYTTTNYSESPYIRNIKINGYILGYDRQYNFHLYESCLNSNNTTNSSLYNFLKQYEHLSGYVDENALNGMYYEDIKYDAETDTIFNTTDNIVDYWIINGQKVYPKDITEQTFIDLDEERTYSDANSVAIGMGLSSYGNSIAINAGTDVSPYYSENRTLNYCRSGTIGNMLTGNTNYTAYLSNSYSSNKEIKSKDNIVTAFGKSIVLGANGKNISAGGNSIAIGNHDIEVTGKSIGIGNNLYSLNQSIVINQNAWGKKPVAMNQSLVIGGSGSWAQGNSFIFGEGNSANNNAYIFGQGNSANGRTFAFGESNYIATGKSFALGYYNYINGSTEVCTIGYRNYANGGSMQNVIMGYDNYMSVGGYSLHLIGNRNSASCGSIYGSVVGNWNMLSHGNSLLAIHGDNNSAFGSLGEANILGHYNVVGGGGNRISIIGYENGRNAPGSYGSYDGLVFGNGNNWNGGSFRSSIIGLNNKISGISYTDMSILGNDNFVSANENGIILGNSNYINSYSNGNLNSTRNILIGVNNTASGYASMNSILLGYSNRVYYGENIAIGDYNYAGNQSFVLGYCNTAVSGDNIGFGAYNNTEHESIGIGKNNNTYGHSITLGWYNTSINGGDYSYAHSIMLGYSNSSDCNYKNLIDKPVNIANYIKYDSETMSNARQRYDNAYNEVYNNNVFIHTRTFNYEYIDVVVPLEQFSDEILIPSDIIDYSNYSGKGYFIIKYTPESYSSFMTAADAGYIPANIVKLYKFVEETAFETIKNRVLTGSSLLNMYNEYTAASAEYYGMVYTNDTYQMTKITASPETNSILIGTNNSASHHNSYLLGSLNQSFSSKNINNSYDDDGFVFAFGLGNKVARNYDIAIGYNSLASGGENIAIGTPQKDENDSTKCTNTSAIGYRNIAVNSQITGIGNFVLNSNIRYGQEYQGYYPLDDNEHNIIFNSEIESYYGNGIHKSILFNEKPINNTPINLGTTNESFISNSLIDKTEINRSIVFANNSALTDGTINRSLVGFGDTKTNSTYIDESILGFGTTSTDSQVYRSYVMNSYLSGASNINNSILIGTSANAYIQSVLAISDGGYTNDNSYPWQRIVNQAYGIFIGQANMISGSYYNSYNTIIGDTNELIGGHLNNVRGNNNTILNSYCLNMRGNTNYLMNTNHHLDVEGEDNTVNTYTYYTKIYGSENKLGDDILNIMKYNSVSSDSEILNNYSPNRIIFKNFESNTIYKTKQNLYQNNIYCYNDSLLSSWGGVTGSGNWDKLGRTTNYDGGLWINGQLWYHRFGFKPGSWSHDFYRGMEYLGNWSYNSNKYLYDYISVDDYNNLPSTEKSKYSYYGNISGKELGNKTYYYRSINWKNTTATIIYHVHVYDYQDDIPVRYEVNNYHSLIAHLEEVDVSTLPQINQQQDIDDIQPVNNYLVHTNVSAVARIGISRKFDNYIFMQSDDLYSDVWSAINYGNGSIYNSKCEGNKNNINGSYVYFTDLTGIENNILNSNSFNSFIYGNNNNIIGGYHYSDFIFGSNNTALSENESTFGFIYGQNNFISGCQTVAIGTDTTARGNLGMAFGASLIANENQNIVGRYNESLPSPIISGNYKSGGIVIPYDTTTGALFVVGNGYYDIYDEQGNQYQSAWKNDGAIHRSNAMIVSADGTVSAKRFVSEESTPIWTSGNISTLATSYDVANNIVIRIENNTVNDYIIFNITGLSADEVPNVSIEFINNQADCYPVFKNGNFELYCTDDTCYSGKSYMFRALGSMSEIIEMRIPRTNVTVNGTDVSVNGNLITP